MYYALLPSGIRITYHYCGSSYCLIHRRPLCESHKGSQDGYRAVIQNINACAWCHAGSAGCSRTDSRLVQQASCRRRYVPLHMSLWNGSLPYELTWFAEVQCNAWWKKKKGGHGSDGIPLVIPTRKLHGAPCRQQR